MLLFLAGCKTNEMINSRTLNTYTIKSAGSFSIEECKARNLSDKVMMIESKYCGHCKATLPDFKDACEEKGMTPIILDVSNDDQRKEMLSHSISIQYTPTFIFGCKYFIGVKSKETYLQLLDELKEAEE